MLASSVRLVILLWCHILNRSDAENEETHSADGLVLRKEMFPAVPSNSIDSPSSGAVWESRSKGATLNMQRTASAADRLHMERLLEELTDYRFVFPYVVSGKRKRSLASLPKGRYPNHLSILVKFAGEQLTLDLRTNTLLLPKGFQVSHYDSNGSLVTEQDPEPSQCYYEGSVRSFTGSAVSASTCSGLSALVVLSNRTYVIEHLGGSEHSRHLMYRPEDLKPVPSRCGVTKTSPGSALAEDLQHLHRVKRDVLQETKYIELVLIADNALYQDQRKNKDAVVKRLLNIANTVDLYYRPFNIRVALIGVEVWTRNQIAVDRSATKTLKRFLQWRKSTLLPRLYNDNAQLILGGTFEGGTSGQAALDAICSADNSGGVNLDSRVNFLPTAAILAHELGHNLGMSHDTETRNCHCPDKKAGCIMEKAIGFEIPTTFSSCSRDDLDRILLHGGGICLFNMPRLDMLVGGPKCGNQYVEKGEECDCGKPKECSDPCCQPSTCKLSRGAECSSTGACCKDCKFRPAGTMCRPKRGECDLPEFCTGRSQDCPNNAYLKDGHTCSNGNLYCSRGACQSADKQCQEIWGGGAISAENICYELTNKQATKFGHCGQDENDKYVKCQAKDTHCGKIQCKGGNTTPLRGGNIHTVSSSLVYNGVKYECRGTFVIFEDTSSSDLVRQGTKCGDKKACIDAKCQDVALFNVESCDKTCHNNGVCNSNNNCHCNDGWAPPYCNSSGIGGSIDSGPVKDEGRAKPSQSPETTASTTTELHHHDTESPDVTMSMDTSNTIPQSTTGPPAKLKLGALIPGVLVPALVLLAIGFIIIWALKNKLCNRKKGSAPTHPTGAVRTSENTFVFVSDDQVVHTRRTHINAAPRLQTSLPNTKV